MELKVNGKSLGRKAMPKNGHLSWKTVYKPGSLVAIGYKNGRKVVTEKVETTGVAMQVRITKHSYADGTNIFDLDLLDRQGRLVGNACDALDVTVSEGAEFLGWGNGDPTFKYVERPVDRTDRTMHIVAFNGHAQVIVKSAVASKFTVAFSE